MGFSGLSQAATCRQSDCETPPRPMGLHTS